MPLVDEPMRERGFDDKQTLNHMLTSLAGSIDVPPDGDDRSPRPKAPKAKKDGKAENGRA